MRLTAAVSSAGVLVRQFDTLNDPAMPWLPCPEDEWCGKFGDRFPSTILNAKAKAMFLADGNGGERRTLVLPASVGAGGHSVDISLYPVDVRSAGIVIAPMVSIYCAYPEDGNSMDGRKVRASSCQARPHTSEIGLHYGDRSAIRSGATAPVAYPVAIRRVSGAQKWATPIRVRSPLSS
jgi:hypothetical protein